MIKTAKFTGIYGQLQRGSAFMPETNSPYISRNNQQKQDADDTNISALLNDISLHVLKEASPDLAPRYIGADSPELKNRNYDGIICTPYGYYRLAECQVGDGSEQNLRVLLFSFDIHKLKGEETDSSDKNATSWLAGKSGVYPVSTRLSMDEQMDGSDFRRDMEDHERKIKESVHGTLNLYATDISDYKMDIDKEKKNPRRIIFTNKAVAYGLFEEQDGKWHVKFYTDSGRKQGDNGFRSIETEDINHPLKNMLSLGEEKGIFDSQAKAYSFIFHDWNKRSYDIWNGKEQDTVSISSAPGVWAKRLAWKEFGKVKAQGKGHTAGAAFSVVPLFIPGMAWAKLGRLLITAVSVVGIGALSKWFVDKIVEGWGVAENKLDELHKKPAPVPGKDIIDDYIIQTPENKRRICMKAPQDFMNSLHPLASKKSAMNHDDGIFKGPPGTKWIRHWLNSLPNKISPAIVFPIDDHTVTRQHLNGLVDMIHIEDGLATVWAGYRPDSDISDFHIKLPESIKTKMETTGILKACYDRASKKQNSIKNLETHEGFNIDVDSVFSEAAQPSIDHIRNLFNRALFHKSIQELEENIEGKLDETPDETSVIDIREIPLWTNLRPKETIVNHI